jgi:hypothetical protein
MVENDADERDERGRVLRGRERRWRWLADQPVSRWAPFYLYEKLKVDSARWGDGEPATVFKVKDSTTRCGCGCHASWCRATPDAHGVRTMAT